MPEVHTFLTERAISDLKAMPKGVRDQIHAEIEAIGSSPFPAGTRIKRPKGFKPPLYRLRSGDFRILYRVEGDTVTILRIIDRKLLDRITKGIRAKAIR